MKEPAKAYELKPKQLFMEIWNLLQNPIEESLEINLSIVGLSYSLEQKQLF